MPPAAQQQPTTNWVGSDEKFPAVQLNPPTDVRVAQLHLDSLPRKDGNSSPVLLALKELCPSPENLFITVVPYCPLYRPLQWIHLPPCFFPALVNWSEFTLFTQRDATLKTTREIYFSRADWVPVAVTTNKQDIPVTVTTQVRIGLAVTNGAEASETVKLRESFVGLNLKYGRSEHTIDKEETRDSSIIDIQYKVPANTTIYAYQRKFTFLYRLLFNIGTKNGAYNVGPDTWPTQAFITPIIHSRSVLYTQEELIDKVAGVDVKTVDPPGNADDDLLDAKTISRIVDRIVESTNNPTRA